VKLALPCPSRSVMPVNYMRLDDSPNHTAVPHRSIKDDRYRGYDIPADAMIIPNVWSAGISLYPPVFVLISFEIGL
jgi:hypothetical protein